MNNFDFEPLSFDGESVKEDKKNDLSNSDILSSSSHIRRRNADAWSTATGTSSKRSPVDASFDSSFLPFSATSTVDEDKILLATTSYREDPFDTSFNNFLDEEPFPDLTPARKSPSSLLQPQNVHVVIQEQLSILFDAETSDPSCFVSGSIYVSNLYD